MCGSRDAEKEGVEITHPKSKGNNNKDNKVTAMTLKKCVSVFDDK